LRLFDAEGNKMVIRHEEGTTDITDPLKKLNEFVTKKRSVV
jgi:hypothetical protein